MPRLRLIPLNIALVAALVACAPEAPRGEETEGRPVWDGAWEVAAGRVVSIEGRLVLRAASGSLTLADELVGAPAVSDDGQRLALCRRGEGPGDSVLETLRIGEDGIVGRWVLEAEGSPDRVALDPAGERVAWVNGAGGVAAVFLATFPDGVPVQLTNVDVERVPGQAPLGFVPPPHDGPLRFEGGALVWASPDGPQRQVLP